MLNHSITETFSKIITEKIWFAVDSAHICIIVITSVMYTHQMRLRTLTHPEIILTVNFNVSVSEISLPLTDPHTLTHSHCGTYDRRALRNSLKIKRSNAV